MEDVRVKSSIINCYKNQKLKKSMTIIYILFDAFQFSNCLTLLSVNHPFPKETSWTNHSKTKCIGELVRVLSPKRNKVYNDYWDILSGVKITSIHTKV